MRSSLKNLHYPPNCFPEEQKSQRCSSTQLQKVAERGSYGGFEAEFTLWVELIFQGNVFSVSDSMFRHGKNGRLEEPRHCNTLSDANLSFRERAISAAGAAVLSAILVNPLDVAKTRLQAQAAGVPYEGPCRMTTVIPNLRCSSLPGSRALFGLEPNCSLECNRCTGTFDVFNKVIRQRDPERALRMNTRTTLAEIWRDGGLKGMFTGLGPRVGRASPSVGIVVSFYEVVKYALYRRQRRNND